MNNNADPPPNGPRDSRVPIPKTIGYNNREIFDLAYDGKYPHPHNVVYNINKISHWLLENGFNWIFFGPSHLILEIFNVKNKGPRYDIHRKIRITWSTPDKRQNIEVDRWHRERQVEPTIRYRYFYRYVLDYILEWLLQPSSAHVDFPEAPPDLPVPDPRWIIHKDDHDWRHRFPDNQPSQPDDWSQTLRNVSGPRPETQSP